VDLGDSILAQRAFLVLDDSGNGMLDFSEFCRALVVYCTFDNAALSLFSYDIFDFDRDGVLTSPDLQRAILEVYGHSSSEAHTSNIKKLLNRAKGYADRQIRASGATVAATDGFALDRAAFDEFVKDVPTLCFPVFSIQQKLWDACGGEAFWKSITRDRQARARRKLSVAGGKGKTYDFHDWRGMVDDIGSPTNAQQGAISKFVYTPKADTSLPGFSELADASGDAKTTAGKRRSLNPRAGPEVSSARSGAANDESTQAGEDESSSDAAAAAAAPASTSGGGETNREKRRSSAFKLPPLEIDRTEVDAPATGKDLEDYRTTSASGRPLSLDELQRNIAKLDIRDVHKVAVFGSAAERRAAAIVLGEIDPEDQARLERERDESAAANLREIKRLTGHDAIDADSYSRTVQRQHRNSRATPKEGGEEAGDSAAAAEPALTLPPIKQRRASLGVTTINTTLAPGVSALSTAPAGNLSSPFGSHGVTATFTPGPSPAVAVAMRSSDARANANMAKARARRRSMAAAMPAPSSYTGPGFQQTPANVAAKYRRRSVATPVAINTVGFSSEAGLSLAAEESPTRNRRGSAALPPESPTRNRRGSAAPRPPSVQRQRRGSEESPGAPPVRLRGRRGSAAAAPPKKISPLSETTEGF
jgi:hypothetical protein